MQYARKVFKARDNIYHLGSPAEKPAPCYYRKKATRKAKPHPKK